MRSKFLPSIIVMMAFLTQPAYSVTDAEFNEMKEQLQNALMKIQALEQNQNKKVLAKKAML